MGERGLAGTRRTADHDEGRLIHRHILSLRPALDRSGSRPLGWAEQRPCGALRRTREEPDVHRPTKRRHIDLARVASAFCRRDV
ncbi:putative leader peptide [Streptacidiphilus albus]|uniref:putative leader peptide n=1 Tax=Streptacidiphilus albus TaxID=105425 RepID=UPI0034E24A81